jgi:zinc transport system substrate-binding protein
MNSKQKIFVTAITVIIIVTVAAAASTPFTPKTDKITAVVTFYPLFYMSEKIGGDFVSVTQIVPFNTEIHSWEPSASNIIATDNADIIVYNGAGADSWMKTDILPSLSTSKDRIIVEATQGLTLIANQDNDEGEEHGQNDPHTWISPYMAKQEGEKIYNAFIQADPTNQEYYSHNWQILENQLTQIDAEYTRGLQNASVSEIFVSHEAFGYLASRYGFEQYGVIGLSGDEQPSATNIANLVEQMEEKQIYVVYVDPVYSTQYAQTIKTEVEAQTGHSVSVLDLYLILGPQVDMDMLQQMQINLDNLKVGLAAT